MLSIAPGSASPGDTITLQAGGVPSGTAGLVTVTLSPSSGAPIAVTASLGPELAGTRAITFVVPSIPLTAPLDFAVTVSGSTSVRPFTSANSLILQLRLSPVISSVSPSAGRAGEVATVTLTVANLDLVDSQSEAQFGDGISVGRVVNTADGQYGLIRVTGPNTGVATIALNTAASLGARTVKVRTAGREATLANGFTVTQGLPAISFVQPVSGSFTNIATATVQGSVNTPVTSLLVNGVAAQLNGTAFQAVVPLIEGDNVITAVATTAAGLTGTASTQVNLDTTPPFLAVNSPGAGYSTSAASVTISGTVNDIVIGTVNTQQVSVSVNGANVAVNNRRFVAADVALVPGDNTMTIIATDRTGNNATSTLTVRRITASVPEIRVFSGNNQTGTAGTLLSTPLVATVVDAAGNPMPNRDVVFRVAESDGSLDATGAVNSFVNNGVVRSVVVRTDSRGQATARWTLGSRAGAGNNRVEASAPGLNGLVSFVASAQAGSAARVLVDAGSNQFGVTGKPLPFPFIVVVTDTRSNRLANVPVVFSVTQGNGVIDGLSTVTRVTDSDGRALVTLTLGPEAGVENNRVTANFAGNPGRAAAFSASGRVAGDAAQTRISGVVLDNSNQPIPGVTMRLFQPYNATANNTPVPVGVPVATNAQGQFLIQPAPVGRYKLMADGGTALRPGPWPTLEYDIVTVAGQNNTVGLPIFLPVLDTVNRLCVSETTGGTLTLPEVPGFSLTVLPGSATFPGGSRSGCVSVTPVHHDKVPMVPSFGHQPRLVVTIQPVGTKFFPPASMTTPNTDGLRPGQTAELFSFDHDLANFVSVGTGTVSEDGRVVKSDPGVGVLKAGWHGAGNPPPPDGGGENVSAALTTLLNPGDEATEGTILDVVGSGSPPDEGTYANWTADSAVGTILAQPACPGVPTCSNRVQLNSPGTLQLAFLFQAASQAQGSTTVRVAPRPRLEVNLTTLKRGGTATFRVVAAAGAVSSDWRFEVSDPNASGQVVVRPDNGMTWTGVMVVGGRARVRVRVPPNGQEFQLERTVTVTARPEFKLPPVPFEQVAHGFTAPNSGVTLTMPDPPTPGSEVGLALWDHTFRRTSGLIMEGPNRGVAYVQSVSDVASSGASTKFYFAVHRQVENPPGTQIASDFMAAQCGTYPIPGGIINRNVLRENIRKHEATSTNRSHYISYKETFERENPGERVEAFIAFIDLASATATEDFRRFREQVRDAFNSKITLITTEYSGHELAIVPAPPPVSLRWPYKSVGFDDLGVYHGPASYGPPYSTCPTP
ncbi:MAG: hypothetical protein JNL98_13700 [Bryobacterales bacterium]|nr:hypothetical protein [Bryobacterales bacterium]